MEPKKAKLIMLRHGQSEWNRLNLFTGWVDVPLSPLGIQEALEAGEKISHIPIDVIFVSSLIRAQMTAMLAMSRHLSKKTPLLLHPKGENKESWGKIYSESAQNRCIPVISAWELNERMYGRLQGMNKQEMIDQFGPELVHRWRRSFREAPPEGESLAMTAERTLPYFQKEILPLLNQGKNVFLSAHGNSMRAIMMLLDHLSETEVVQLELATGAPILYTFERGAWSKDCA